MYIRYLLEINIPRHFKTQNSQQYFSHIHWKYPHNFKLLLKNRLHNYNGLRGVTQTYFLQVLYYKRHTLVPQKLVYPYEYRRRKPKVLSLPQGKLAKQGYYPKAKTGFLYSNCYKSKQEQQAMNQGSCTTAQVTFSTGHSVCCICIARKIHKVSYATEKAYFEKKKFLKKQNPKKPSHAQVTPS